ncbi:hypothetical protein ACOSQ3_020528 [Xanthoceras sorbifolium]
MIKNIKRKYLFHSDNVKQQFFFKGSSALPRMLPWKLIQLRGCNRGHLRTGARTISVARVLREIFDKLV